MLRKALSALTNSRKKRTFLGLMAFLIIVGWLGSAILHSGLFKRYIISKASQFLKNKYNLSLSMDSIRYSLSKLTVQCHGIEVRAISEEDYPFESLAVEQLLVDMNLMSLIFGDLHFENIQISRPKIAISQNPNKKVLLLAL